MKIANSLFSFLFLASTLIFPSCIQNSISDPADDVVVIDDDSMGISDSIEPLDSIPAIPPILDIAVFTEFPEGIDGCACYFGKTAPELSAGQYIFMTDYAKKAYMKLDGQMRVFDLMSSTVLDGGRLMEKWSNARYEMVVKTTQTGSIDETWQSLGTINIQPKNKMSTTISVVGECGC